MPHSFPPSRWNHGPSAGLWKCYCTLCKCFRVFRLISVSLVPLPLLYLCLPKPKLPFAHRYCCHFFGIHRFNTLDLTTVGLSRHLFILRPAGYGSSLMSARPSLPWQTQGPIFAICGNFYLFHPVGFHSFPQCPRFSHWGLIPRLHPPIFPQSLGVVPLRNRSYAASPSFFIHIYIWTYFFTGGCFPEKIDFWTHIS